jgi:hypothetical protein
MPQVDLPRQLVIPLEALATFWALANIVLGFIYLLYGLKVFRVMTTITAVLWGAALGMMFGDYIDSIIVAVVFCGTGLGVATWFYTRWMIALPFGLGSAAIAWLTAKLNGANPLACFFIAMAGAVGIGGPVLIFYRTVVMGLTCIQGAVLVVIGTAGGILLMRGKPISLLLVDFQTGTHLILGSVCVLLLAIPAFYYQRLRYGVSEGGSAESFGETSAKESAPKKKAA